MSFDSLPGEVCHEIFLLYLKESFYKQCYGPYTDRKEPYTISNHPTLFTSVCKHWTDVALSSPQLWTFMNIVVLNEPPSSGESGVQFRPPLPIVQKSIQLSNNLPLSFSVIPWHDLVENTHAQAYNKCVKSMLDEVLVPHHARWQRVTIHQWPNLDMKFPFPFALDKTPTFPQLRQFTITTSPLPIDPPDRSFAQGVIHVMRNAPVLQNLGVEATVQDYFCDWTPASTPRAIAAAIPWKRLTTLNIYLGFMSATETLKLLEQSPNLESLALPVKNQAPLQFGLLWLALPSTLPHIPGPKIHHNRLRELSFSMADFLCCAALLNHLTLPNLRSLFLPPDLAFPREDTGRGDLIKAVTNLVQRSNCQLRKLFYTTRIYDAPHRPEPVSTVALLQTVSSTLEELSIRVHDFQDIAAALTVPTGRGGSVLCPRLRRMDIALKKTPNPLGIVEMIESRSTPSAQLLGVAKLQMVGVTFTMGSEGLDATDTLWNPRSPQILHDAVKRLRALALQEGVTDPSPNNPWPQVFRVTSQVHSEFYPMVEGCGDYVYLNTTLPEPDKVRFYPF